MGKHHPPTKVGGFQFETVKKDIGIDVYPTNDGDVIEERRHLVRCKYCNARRTIFERRSSKKGELAERKSE